VREGSRPISADTGLKDIQAAIAAGRFPPRAARVGTQQALDIRERYIQHLLGYVDLSRLKPLKVVVNAGNGGAGLIVDLLEPQLPFQFIKLNHAPDGSFPNGVPNPMLEENRHATRQAVLDHGADVGLAWDGDYDRCFFFDEEGTFIEGYYLVGLLAEVFLKREPGARIVHDPRLTWNTIDMVSAAGGVPVLSKSGHAFIKQKMREVDGAYGGEMSAHHYFRSFAYCDSGMIPWLLVLQVICQSGKSLSQQVYAGAALNVDFTDGLSVEFAQWRFNLRGSNTEPLVRLNVESRGSVALMQEKTEELLRLIRG
jgi:phosphomannomutase